MKIKTSAEAFINVWPEGLTEEPRAEWRKATCHGCSTEFATSANKGPLPRLCVPCIEDFRREEARVTKARQRARRRGVAEEDLPDLPVMPEHIEPTGDGEWLNHSIEEAFPLPAGDNGEPVTPRKEDDNGNQGDYMPGWGVDQIERYVNSLGLPRRIGGAVKRNVAGAVQSPEGSPVIGLNADAEERYLRTIVEDQTRDHLWIARREVESLAARGRATLRRLHERRQDDLRWEFVDIMYDIAEQEGCAPEPVYEDGRRLRWDHAAIVRHERRVQVGSYEQ